MLTICTPIDSDKVGIDYKQHEGDALQQLRLWCSILVAGIGGCYPQESQQFWTISMARIRDEKWAAIANVYVFENKFRDSESRP